MFPFPLTLWTIFTPQKRRQDFPEKETYILYFQQKSLLSQDSPFATLQHKNLTRETPDRCGNIYNIENSNISQIGKGEEGFIGEILST
jgi:hypothetical protein